MLLKTITVFWAILLLSSFASMAFADKIANQSILDNTKTSDGNNGYKPDRLNLTENVAVTVHHKHVDQKGNTITETAVYTSLNQNSLAVIKQNSDTKTTMDRIWNLDRVRFNGRSIVSENALWNNEIFAGKLASLVNAELYNGKQTNHIENNFVAQSNKTSNQGTIQISNAQQLDSSRNFLKDEYQQLHARDGNWTGYIPVDNYLRITFAKNLTSSNDVTIFAKSNYSNASVEVYEKNSDNLVAHFGNITQDKQYRIFLSKLGGTHDTFDLKIVGSLVDFDYIVDPSFSATHTDKFELRTNASTGKAVKDSVAISESAKIPQKKVSDAILLSEKATTSRGVKDSVAISESAKIPQKKVSDAIPLSEEATPSSTTKDVVAISESASVNTSVFHPVLVSDTISLSEKATPSSTAKEVVAISDSVKIPQKHVTDTISLSEKAAPSTPVRDVVTITESTASKRGTFASLSESISIDGTVSTNSIKGITLTETITTSDQLTNSLSKSITESILADDETISTSRINSVSLRESITIDDGTVSTFGNNSISLTESLSASDGISTSGLNSLSLTESITFTSQMNGAKSLSLSENVITDDNIGENLAANQNLVSNIQKTITVDPVKIDLVISSSNASLSTVTVPSTVTNAELNYSKIVHTGSTDTVHIDNPLTITKDTNGDSQPDVQVTIPASTTIDGPVTWRGVVTLPTVVTNPPLPHEPNTIITPSKSVELGFGSTTLTFDKGVRMSFTGDAGKRVGYFNSVIPFTEITATCGDDTQATNDGLPAGGNCKIIVGSDLVVWTKHFTGFASFSSSSSGSGGGNGGGTGGAGGGAGTTGAGPSSGGTGGGSIELGGKLMPYLVIQKVSYDLCDTKTVKIVVATDNSKDPTVIIRSSMSGVVDAQLSSVQPYAAQNVNATIRTLVYEAHMDPKQKSFEVLALAAIGNDIYSEGKTIEVTGCQETINFVNELSQPTQIDLSAPKIFDTKFQIGNATKVLSSDITDQYVDNLPMSVYSIIDSPTPLDRAELRYVTLGQDTSNYAAVKMDIENLPVTNSTYVISGMIPPQFMKSPALQYWIHVQNQARKSMDSTQYRVGVKPGFPINGKLELDVIPNSAAGTTITSDAYFTNNSTRPVFGTISFLADGNMVYISTPHLFDLGQTPVQLKWKTTVGNLTTHLVQARAEFYGKLLDSKIKIENTFQSTENMPLSQPKLIGPILDQDGHTIAIPVIIHSSYNNQGHMRYTVTSPDGTCVIGANVKCLLTNSTLALPGEIKSVTLGDQIYRVRYSGPSSPLERFSITSIDPIVGKWKVEIDSQDGLVPQYLVMQHTLLQIKFKPQSTVAP